MDIYKSDAKYDLKMDAYSLDPTNCQAILNDLDVHCPVVFSDKEKREQEIEESEKLFWEEEMQNREDYYNEYGWGELEAKRHNIASTLPHFESKEAAIRSVQDEFVQTLTKIRDDLPSSQLKERYTKAINELQEVYEPEPCFADEYPRKAMWADSDDYTYTLPFLKTKLTCDYLAKLDWRLIIIYSPYLIKRFGFSNWFYSFRLKTILIDEAKKKINQLHLDNRGKKILLQLINYAKQFKSPCLSFAPVEIHLFGFFEWLNNEDVIGNKELVDKRGLLLLNDEQKKIALNAKSCLKADGGYYIEDGESSLFYEDDV